MQYDLSIRQHNRQAHIDIEEDLQRKKNGLFTFVLRINAGNIVDYSLMEQASGKIEYHDFTALLQQVIVKKKDGQ
jgi:hypothetical protein